jgi:predicted dehydrogenase
MNQSIHMIDLLQYMMGPVEQVGAFTSKLGHPQIETEDAGVGILKFRNNALGIIYGTTASWPGQNRRMEIAGTKGRIAMDHFDSPGFDLYKDGEIIPYGVNRATHTHIGLFNHFTDIILNGTEPELSAENGCHVSKIMEAAYQSAEKMQWIDIV